MREVTLITGDGIGQEISKSLKRVFKAIQAPIKFDTHQAGKDLYETEGILIKDETIEAIQRSQLAIKGPLTTPIGEGFRSINVQLRKDFDLYANIRPIQTMMDHQYFTDVDLIVFRENTEDLYAGIEEQIDEDTAHSIKVITRSKSERIIREAFKYADTNELNKVTIVTKANIMKLTDGMFLEVGRNVQKEYPHIELEEILVDNMAMQLVMDPTRYKVIVTQNLYGDILSDLAAGLVGGMGLIAGANIGTNAAIFEPAHGSAPDIAGKNIANPTALLLSGVMLLEHIGEIKLANRLKTAINQTIANADTRTQDLGGSLTTSEYTDEVIKNFH